MYYNKEVPIFGNKEVAIFGTLAGDGETKSRC